MNSERAISYCETVEIKIEKEIAVLLIHNELVLS